MFKQRVGIGCLRQLVSSSKNRLAHTTCESPPQYDVPEKMRKLFEIKQKQREATKAYYQKLIMNPYRPKDDGVPFDPVLFRYNALMTYHADYFKPNMKNMAIFWLTYIMPIALMYWYTSSAMESREKKYRAGEVPYENRLKGVL